MATNREILFVLKMRNEASATLRNFANEAKAQGKSLTEVAKSLASLRQANQGLATTLANTSKNMERMSQGADGSRVRDLAGAVRELKTASNGLSGNAASVGQLASSLRLASNAVKNFNAATRGNDTGSTSLQKLVRDIGAVAKAAPQLQDAVGYLSRISQAAISVGFNNTAFTKLAQAMTQIGKGATQLNRLDLVIERIGQRGPASMNNLTQAVRNLDSALGASANLQRFVDRIDYSRRLLQQTAAQAAATQAIFAKLGQYNVGGRASNPVAQQAAQLRAQNQLMAAQLQQQRLQAQQAQQQAQTGRGRASASLGAAGISGAALAGQNPLAGAVAGVISVGAIAQAISTLANYEQSLANVRAVTAETGETAAQAGKRIDELNRFALQFGANSTVGPKAMADVLTELGKAGFDAAKSMQAANAVVSLGQATNYDFTQSAEAMVQALQVFKIDVKDASKVSDIFTKTVNMTTADMTDFRFGLKYAAPLASALGMLSLIHI